MTVKHHRKLVLGLLLITCSMFGFGFALVPIYNKMCSALGINGKPSMLAQNYDIAHAVIQKDRTVLVEFVATHNPSLPWQFYPETKRIRVHPGEISKLTFYAENQTNRSMTVQAVPSVTPGLAAKYVKKTECFCFTKQTLNGHEAMHMPLLFHLEPDLPSSVHTMTLSYTLFDVTGRGA